MDMLPCETDQLNEPHELLLVSYFRASKGNSDAENKYNDKLVGKYDLFNYYHDKLRNIHDIFVVYE